MGSISIQDVKDALIIDHEDVGDVIFECQKKKVASLKQARTALLEDDFRSIIFLSLLEESNEIEVFVNGVRSHPRLSSIPIFCEYGLSLALPKELGLVSFEESDFSEDNSSEGIDDSLNLESSIDESVSSGTDSEKNSIIEEMKKVSAKALVTLELDNEIKPLRKNLYVEYIKILQREFNE